MGHRPDDPAKPTSDDSSQGKRRSLSTGYEVSRLIQGGWQWAQGHSDRETAETTSLEVLKQNLAAGITTFDCADIYTGVEELYGQLLKSAGEDRERIRIHTKYVPDLDRLGRLTKEEVEKTIDRSLIRLGVERLDLVQFHWWDFEIKGHVETATLLKRLQDKGKIHSLGVTNYDTERLQELLDADLPIKTNQVQYSLVDRRPEGTLVDFCLREGIDLLCYGALAGGFLTNRWCGSEQEAFEGSLTNRSLVKYRLILEESGQAAYKNGLAMLSAIGEELGCDPAAVALRWVLDQPAVAAVIVGMTRPGRVQINRHSESLEFKESHAARLESAFAASVPGEVYALERDRSGPHGQIMRYDLNES